MAIHVSNIIFGRKKRKPFNPDAKCEICGSTDDVLAFSASNFYPEIKTYYPLVFRCKTHYPKKQKRRRRKKR